MDEVDDEGDEPRVGAARVPFWAGAQVNPRVTNPVWVRHGCRFGLVLKSTPTKQPSQLPRDALHVTVVGLEGLSTCGVYTLCLDSSPGHPFLGRGFRYLSLCCTVV